MYLQYRYQLGNLAISDPPWVMWTYFHCTPGVSWKYFQGIKLLPTRVATSEYIFTVTYELEQNVFRQILALKVFSAGNFSLGISHKYIWTTWSHVHTFHYTPWVRRIYLQMIWNFKTCKQFMSIAILSVTLKSYPKIKFTISCYITFYMRLGNAWILFMPTGDVFK